MATGGSLIGALRVTLGLDSAQFEAGTKRARGIAQRDATAIQKSLSGIKGALNGLITAATVTALVAAGKRALDYAGSLGEVSQQLGVTTRDLQVYRFIASQVGIEQDAMDSGLAKLTKTMGEADNGSKKQANAFRELGVSVKDANGNLLTAGDVMPRLADAFAKIKDPITRARIETELFGKSGQRLDTLLSGGSAAINDMTAQAERLGLIMGDSLIKKADEASDKIAVLTKVLEVQFAKAVAENADGILSMADAFITLIGWIGNAISGLQDFALAAKQTFRQMKGWSLFGQPVDSEEGRKARLAFFNGTLQQDERAGRAATFNQIKLPKPQGALPVAAGGGGGGRRRGGGRGSRDHSAQNQERFDRELAGLEDDQLRLQGEITTDEREKARLEHLRLETAQAAYEHELETKQKAGELTAAQAQALKTAYEANATREHTLVNWKLDDQLVEQELSVSRAALDNANNLLQGDLDAARTQADRRRIQLAILDNEQKLERASLEAVIAKHDSTEAEKQIAQAKLDQLGKEYGQRAGAVRRDTMGPMEAYLSSLPKTADEINEAFQKVAADGVQSLTDGLTEAIMQSKSLGDVFKNVANQIIADLIRIQMQKAISEGLSKVLSSLGSAAGSTQGSVDVGNAAKNTASLPKFATGGSFRIGGGGVDNQMLSVGGIPRAMVSGSETVHVVPANDRGQNGPTSRVEVVPSPYFNVVVDGRAAGVAGGMYASGSRTSYRRSRQRLA